MQCRGELRGRIDQACARAATLVGLGTNELRIGARFFLSSPNKNIKRYCQMAPKSFDSQHGSGAQFSNVGAHSVVHKHQFPFVCVWLCVFVYLCVIVCICVCLCAGGLTAVNMQFSNSRGGDWSRSNGRDGESTETVAGQFKDKQWFIQRSYNHKHLLQVCLW